MIRGRVRAACLLILIYLGLTVVFTYPLAWHFGTHHVGEAGGDAKVYLWNYWWVSEALFELGTSPFVTNRIFHPIGIGLSLHTLGTAQGIVFAPLSWLFGDIAAANAIVTWTFVASALATFVLARRLGAGSQGAFLAGLAFAFCPYRLARLSGHYDLLGTEWIPLYILLLLELADGRKSLKIPDALVALATGIVLAVCGYTALSYLVFLAVVTFIVLAFRASAWHAIVPRLLLSGGVAAILLAPLLLQLGRDLSEWTYPTYPGADRYVADVAGFFVPPPTSAIVPGRAFGDNLTEATVFPGYVLMALAALGWRHRLWLAVGSVFFVLSLGSSLHVWGRDTGVPLPFWLVGQMPLFDNLRAPARFAIVLVLALAMMMALSWKPRRTLTTAAVAAVIVVEYLAVPVPLFQSEVHDVYRLIAADDDARVVAEIPGIEQSPGEIMFHQRIHEKPIFVGTAARVPVEKSEYWLGLPLVRPLIDLRKGRLESTPELVERERSAAPAVARFLDIGWFVIDKAYAKRGVVTFIEEVLPVEPFFEDERLVVLRTRESDLPDDPLEIAASDPVSRQHFESGWMRPEHEQGTGFRWAHRERSTLLFRRPPAVTTLELTVAPLAGGADTVALSLDGRSLGTYALAPGWQPLVVSLPPSDGGVERLALTWSGLGQASERDPRRLAARVRSLRLLP